MVQEGVTEYLLLFPAGLAYSLAASWKKQSKTSCWAKPLGLKPFWHSLVLLLLQWVLARCFWDVPAAKVGHWSWPP